MHATRARRSEDPRSRHPEKRMKSNRRLVRAAPLAR